MNIHDTPIRDAEPENGARMILSEETIPWETDGQTVSIAATRCGSGPRLLMLPAPSSISTRAELRALQQILGAHYECIAVDLPGFGDLPKPKIDWRPEHMRAWLRFIFAHFGKPEATLAAGHAAGYLVAHAASHPGETGALYLLSPTWRGPLPTMAGKRLPIFTAMAKAVDPPFIGAAFYRLNVNKAVIGLMARGHVYGDPAWFSPERAAAKSKVTEAPGARHASFRFVTGELDPFHSREAFLQAVRKITTPITVLYGERTPRKTMAEINALKNIPGVRATALQGGKLSFYEERPEETARVLLHALHNSHS